MRSPVEKRRTSTFPLPIQNLVAVIVPILLRREVELHLGAPHAIHLFLDIGRIDIHWKHECDHE
jgi:hypothetical protein